MEVHESVEQYQSVILVHSWQLFGDLDKVFIFLHLIKYKCSNTYLEHLVEILVACFIYVFNLVLTGLVILPLPLILQ